MEDMKKHPRYPYTFCADLIRNVAGFGENGTKISRSDASQIRQLFSKVLNLDDETVAKMMADYYLKHEDELAQQAADELLAAMNRRR